MGVLSQGKSWFFASGSLALVLVLLLGCSSGVSYTGEPISQSLAENGSDLLDLTSRLAMMTAGFVSEGEPQTLEIRAVRAAAGGFYAPGKCLSFPENDDPSAVVVSFSNCEGPWGLSGLSGDVVLQRPKSGGLIVGTSPKNQLKLGGASVSFSAAVNVYLDGAERTLKWATMTMSGTTTRGQPFSIENASATELALVWQVGEMCVTINGTEEAAFSKAPAGAQYLSAQAEGLERCGQSCPSVGGEWIWPMETTSPGSLSKSAPDVVDVTISGMSVAYYTSGGQRNPIELVCGP
jgi:hypothetical protein